MNEVLLETSIEYDVWYWKLEATVHCESFHYDMRVIEGVKRGSYGEIGAVQLLPGPYGMLPVFYRLGFDKPTDFRQSVRFLAHMINLGYSRYWSCYPR